MSSVDDETRLYECSKKYDKIVKQFDQLIGMMDEQIATRKRSKRRRVSSSSGGSNSSTSRMEGTSGFLQNDNGDGRFVQTIATFLHELRAGSTEPYGSPHTHTQNPHSN